MNIRILRSISIFTLILGLAASQLALAQTVVVNSADPASAVQGTDTLDVTIGGKGFARDAVVEFVLKGPKNADHQDIAVNETRIPRRNKIIANITVPLLATAGEYDIVVRSRGGKGTTLFKVQAKGDSGGGNDCNLEFEAILDGLPGDGVFPDEEGDGSYVAIGGPGFRLDTNGSMKLERNNDTRFVYIDFLTAEVCANADDSISSNDTFEPTGFCHEWKGIDLRIEHEKQNFDGLCSIEPGGSKPATIFIKFLSGPDITEGTLTNEFKNGKDNSRGPIELQLNYGCEHLRTNPDDFNPDNQATIHRLTDFGGSSWYIEGQRACLTTNLGHTWVDGNGAAIWLEMPFGITIVDVNKLP